MWRRIKRLFKREPDHLANMTPEQEERLMKNLEAMARLYHGAVRKYGDDGHDQFVDLVSRQSTGDER